jgi:hypothetical protein
MHLFFQVVRLSSNMYMRNRSPVPARIAVVYDSKYLEVGLCQATSSLLQQSKSRLVPYNVKDGTLSKSSSRLGIRFDGMTKLVEMFQAEGKGSLAITISPIISGIGSEVQGILEVEVDKTTFESVENHTIHFREDVVCKSSDPDVHDFVLQAAIKMMVVAGERLVTYISLEPRAMLVSTIPLKTTILKRHNAYYTRVGARRQD